jgi:predicted HTH domain antitoxin
MSVVIPDDLINAAQMTESEFKLEVAMMLYQQGKISGGKAREFAGLNIVEFRQEMAKRQIDIAYDSEDLQADIETLKSPSSIMRIVSDTSPITSLAAIDQLELLHQLYDTVIIPQAVYEEMTEAGNVPGAIEVQTLSEIQKQQVQNREQAIALRTQ